MEVVDMLSQREEIIKALQQENKLLYEENEQLINKIELVRENRDIKVNILEQESKQLREQLQLNQQLSLDADTKRSELLLENERFREALKELLDKFIVPLRYCGPGGVDKIQEDSIKYSKMLSSLLNSIV